MKDGRASERKIGRYALYGEIASGGMATVHFGRLLGSAGFARTVAIKRLHPHFAKDPEFVTMFLDEAHLAARIKHPNVVPILDVISEENELLIVMEYVHGESLSRILRALEKKHERPPLKIVSSVVCGLLHGLHAAHEALDEHGGSLGIVHRDVSPQNVLVGADGTTRVLDFGVAKAMGRAQVTREGQLKGKFAYMAPEQLQRAPVDRRADIFASAIVLWEMLTLRRLFDGDSELAIIAQITMKEILPPSSLGIELPSGLEAVVMKGLAKNPDERFQTAQEMAKALEAAIPPASAWEVTEWVAHCAKEALARRDAQVQAIERNSSASGASRASIPSLDGAADARSLASVTRVEGTGSQVAQSSRLPMVLFAMAALVALGLGAFFALRPAAPTGADEKNAHEPPPPTPSSAPPPAIPSVPSAASSVAAPEVASALPSASAAAPASSPIAVPTQRATATATATAKTTKTSSCSPPYTIDSKGIKRMKPECL